MIRHHTLSPLHFYTRAREESLNNTHGVHKQKTRVEAGYEEKALHPPSSSGESKWGGGHGQEQTGVAGGMSLH